MAQDVASWTFTGADFHVERVALRGIDGSGVSVSTVTNDPQVAAPRTVKFDDFLQLQRLPLPRPQPAKFLAVMADGDRIAGEPGSTSGETILWNNRVLGEMKLPMKQLRAILRFGTQLDSASGAADEARTDDVVLLSNGDTVRGILADLSTSAATIQPAAGGDPSIVPLDSVLAILLATPGGAAATNASISTEPAPRAFRVTLSDSSTITSPLPVLRSGTLQLTDGSSMQRHVPLDSVVAIEQLNGPVVWVPSLRPSENVQTPFLDLAWPARMDATLDGDPIRFADQTWAHGIGVHSYSRLSFAIDPSILAFRTRYAIDGVQPYANVTVRIKLDGRIAYEQADVTAGKLTGPVVVETRGARTLTLEVDYGKNQDVQDRFNWIESALLRYVPRPPAAPKPAATSPATQP
jgi:hypothetical protein